MPKFRVTAGVLNLRGGPGTNHPVIKPLPIDTVVERLETSSDGKWFRVSVEVEGQTREGWVAAQFLEPVSGETMTTASGWVDQIGDFEVERAEIKRPQNRPYFNNSHTMIGVMHTTESGTVQSAFNALSSSHSAPHFIAGEGRILQCRPINVQGAALRSTNQYNPNTDAACQIEMVGFSQQTLWLPPDGSLRPVVAIMRWAAGDPLNIPLRRPLDAWLDECSDCALPWAVTTNKRRKTQDVWPREKGWYMHMEVPVNHHWDCGALRMRDMLRMAAEA